MSCCDENTARVPGIEVSRRSLFKGAAFVASVIPAVRPDHANAQQKQVKLAYCSQLLCGVPYEVARSSGIFKNHGLDVELVYTRGGNAAMQALVGGAVDYAATSLDVAIQAYANVGAPIRRFAVTGRLPLFAVVTAPKTADKIRSIKDLEGKTVGVSALGNADHALTLYLLEASWRRRLEGPVRDDGGQSPGSVAPGADRRRRRAGAGADAAEARSARGCWSTRWIWRTPRTISAARLSSWAWRCGPRRSRQRRPEMVALTQALADALKALRGMSGEQLVAALPKEMTTGLDLKELGADSRTAPQRLYPETVTIDLDAAMRVAHALEIGGLVKPGANIAGLLDTTIVGG